jgi:hypothetical protein
MYLKFKRNILLYLLHFYLQSMQTTSQKTLAPSSNYYNAFIVDIPIALLDLRCKMPQSQYIFCDNTSNSKILGVI